MNSLTISICDDNLTSLSHIQSAVQKLLQENGCQGIISTYSSSRELYDLVQEGNVTDLYLLDIDMPEVSGLELSAMIRKIDKKIGIMFVSAREEYVFEAIKARPFRFIRKSHFRQDIKEAMEGYLEQSNLLDGGDVLTLQVQTETYRFHISEILYVQAKDNYLDVVTAKKTTLIRYKISELEKALEEHQFLRIHKSYLVNFRYIYRLRPKAVLMENGLELPLGRSRQAEVQQKFKEYMKGS